MLELLLTNILASFTFFIVGRASVRYERLGKEPYIACLLIFD
jgi:hypothetical protein